MRTSTLGYSFLAISTFISTPVLGQALDPNLQVRIENAMPLPDVKPRLPQVENVPVQQQETYTATVTVTLTPEERKRRLKKVLRQQNKMLPMAASPKELNELMEAFKIPTTESRKIKRTHVVTKIVATPVARQTKVTAQVQSQSAFDTNALKSNLNRVSDWVFTNSASLTVDIPVGTLDNLVFQTGVADQRYARLFTRDIELLTNIATYNHVLGAVSGPNGLISPGTTTVDALSYSLSSTTVFGVGFSPYQVELYTPSVAWGRTNIDLGGTVCGPKDKEVYCVSGGAAAAGEFTFSDIATRENFAARLQGGVVWSTAIDGLTTTASGIIQGRYYTAFPGGRQDLLVQAAIRADYKVNPSIVLSGVLQVGQQFSTFRPAQWNGLTVFPVLKLQMAL